MHGKTHILRQMERMSVICIIILVKVRVRISCNAEMVSAAPVTRSSKYAVCLKCTLKVVNPAVAIWKM